MNETDAGNLNPDYAQRHADMEAGLEDVRQRLSAAKTLKESYAQDIIRINETSSEDLIPEGAQRLTELRARSSGVSLRERR